MRYLLIDEDGLLHDKTGTWAQIEAEVGDAGWDWMRLSSRTGLRGLVSDCGLIMPDRFRRNPVGGTVGMSIGAVDQPWAGPVVLVGFRDGLAGAGPVDVDDFQVGVITRLHRAVRSALGLPVDGETAAEDVDLYTPRAVAAYRNVAAMISDAPHRGFRVLQGDEALAHLEAMGRDLR
ncbi:MAG TPA: hypothetical protein VHA75_01150 [Rugosimonospora sp.]|nr:hypothetical protein [Rugosimonospora sp.]